MKLKKLDGPKYFFLKMERVFKNSFSKLLKLYFSNFIFSAFVEPSRKCAETKTEVSQIEQSLNYDDNGTTEFPFSCQPRFYMKMKTSIGTNAIT